MKIRRTASATADPAISVNASVMLMASVHPPCAQFSTAPGSPSAYLLLYGSTRRSCVNWLSCALLRALVGAMGGGS